MPRPSAVAAREVASEFDVCHRVALTVNLPETSAHDAKPTLAA